MMNSGVDIKTDNRQARSDATRHALMRAAEKLIADQGIENVTTRDILGEAGQKNTSALQYHFKGLNGLLAAIHAQRAAETQEKRAELVRGLQAATENPTLRDICSLMIQPAFDLARSSVDFRRYVKAFGHELALAETSAFSRATVEGGGGGSSGEQVGELLREALPHLNGGAYLRRMDSAVRLCSASMYHQARQANAFRGEQAELFFNGLLDALVGLLSAPESDVTQALAETLETR